MSINHIFIFTDTLDKSANELISFGFKEGSSRIHPGQGTKNRKFYFENFYLELLYMYDEKEIKSDLTSPTKLYERSQYKYNDFSPLGLCLDYDKKDRLLFDGCLKYKPIYLPKNMEIEVITNENTPFLPWTFRWQMDIKNQNLDEPINQYILSKARFGILKDINTTFIKELTHYKEIEFEKSENIHLILELNNNSQNRIKHFQTIPLTIKF